MTPHKPRYFLPAMLTGCLLYLAHFPNGHGWLGWVALVPLLTLVRKPAGFWRITLAAYLSGVLFYAPASRWLTTTDSRMYLAWGFLVVYGSLYPVVGVWLLRWLDRRARWPLILSVPCVWTALEFAKGNLLTGFPWYLMAHTQHDFPLLIQIADLGGAWMVSFVVLAVNGLLAEAWLAWSPEPVFRGGQESPSPSGLAHTRRTESEKGVGVRGAVSDSLSLGTPGERVGVRGSAAGDARDLPTATTATTPLTPNPSPSGVPEGEGSRTTPSGRSLSQRMLLAQVVGVVLLLGATLGYGGYRLSEETQRPGPLVAMVQSNVEQGYRNEGYARPGVVREKIRDHLEALTNLAARHKPLLIAWPETSLGGDFFTLPDPRQFEDFLNTHEESLLAQVRELYPRAETWTDKAVMLELRTWFKDCTEMARNAAFRWRTTMVLGLNTRVPDAAGRLRRYNSGVVIHRGGIVDGVYHKIHCVPFGEYAPFEWLKGLMPFDYPYMIHPGSEWPRFNVETEDGPVAKFGVLICYEDTDPNIARPYGGSDGQPAVDFLVNISNDGWFVDSAEHAEHLAICRFRAIENRRAIVRSVNMGISAVVDANGRVLRPTLREVIEPKALLAPPLKPAEEKLDDEKPVPLLLWEIGPEPSEWQALPVSEWKEYQVNAGVLLATVPIDSRESLYVHWGDWFPWTCAGLSLVGLLWGWFRPRPRLEEAKP